MPERTETAPGLRHIVVPAGPRPDGLVFRPLRAPAQVNLRPGRTLLAVEDSRLACEALRLMCQRIPLRLRRAETLAGARAHLAVYRPDAVLIDLGLPDGPGEDLIAELARARQRPAVILATSGDADGRARALDAGADGFLEKPVPGLAAFTAALAPIVPASADRPVPAPDLLALRDDLARAAEGRGAAADADLRQYLRGFVAGLARQMHDPQLEEAALAATGGTGLDRLHRLLSQRLGTGAISGAASGAISGAASG